MKNFALPILERHPLRIAVFLSGNGRTLQNLIDVSAVNNLRIVAVASNNSKAHGLRRAFDNHIDSFVAARNANTSQVLIKFAETYNAQLICLTGYNELLTMPEKD